jgi:hypothetical protein
MPFDGDGLEGEVALSAPAQKARFSILPMVGLKNPGLKENSLFSRGALATLKLNPSRSAPNRPAMDVKYAAVVLLGLSGAIGLISTPAAQAGPSPVLQTCVSGFLSNFLAPGFTGCTRGDKNFTSFLYTGSQPANEIELSLTGAGASYTVSLNPNGPLSGTGTFGFTVAVNNTSTDLLSTLASGQLTSVQGSTFTGSTTATNASGTCGSASSVSSWSCALTPLTFGSNVVSTDVFSTWNAPSGLTQVSTTINQRSASTGVPAPLPILGAGMAYKLSRRLRRRIHGGS